MSKTPLVQTIPNKCRMCYTCVRECPAKAIRISGGQAEVVDDRCIGCGNCIRVCTRGAKKPVGSIAQVTDLLSSGETVAAIIAPSFPAEFSEISPEKVAGMIKAMGFSYVCEVAFGADIVAHAYRRLLNENPEKRFIGATCPAVVSYVEKYIPELVPHLAPIVSPMVAEAKVVRKLYGEETNIVFIGPCIAKKGEAEDETGEDVAATLTFAEMRTLLALKGIDPEKVDESGFNPPTPGLGTLFPVNRGMLQAADMQEDLVSGKIVTADGRDNFVEALMEFASDDMEARLLEVLCCHGCIMGPGMTTKAPIFRRRAKISRYARESLEKVNFNAWNIASERCADINLARKFTPSDERLMVPSEVEVNRIMERMGKFTIEDELNCGACGYETCRKHAIATFKGLAESEMCLPYAIDQLKNTVEELAVTHDELVGTQVALKHAEKMADMGQLAAGIAHEVNNPLGVVLMFAHTLLEEHTENDDLREDLKTISIHADRCKKIVAGLLDFARQNKVTRTSINIPELIRKVISVIKRPDGIELEFISEDIESFADLDEDQMAQVFTNLATNAFQAMGDSGKLTVKTGGDAEMVKISFSDTGSGIKRENLKKVFEPFFTTKERGEGTGLGLAVTYGIVKMHRGQITVDSNSDPSKGSTGTVFKVVLPRRGPGN
ncbi:MAG: 4Fe-4S binding protein [Candidatus Sabulitectum sp.]|nr:4Fe-4S binding protein [Candidatus Sabulitectum sp.]